ncbi:hypothetical protein BD560DRAFT_493092 [Blakeslea trispora]|nr:hypothetical protein BD560DRAFT_493092 [Blakeslea trispora]
MSCPNCGSTQTDVNEIDGYICCFNCGTVVDEVPLTDTFELSYTHVPVTSIQKSGNYSLLIPTFKKAAIFFSLPNDLVERGRELCKEFISKSYSRDLNEAAIAIVFIVGRSWKPDWSLQDFVEAFPIPLHLRQVQRIYSFLNRDEYKIHWRTPQEELDYFIARIYPLVTKQIYRDDVHPKELSLSDLKSKTRALLELGTTYCLNTGKKARPLIVVTALIAGLSLRVSNTFGHQNRKKISAQRWFSFSEFASVCFYHKAALSTRYEEYLDLLLACAHHIPWITKAEKSYVHYYLDDILNLFGTKTPCMTLTIEQYAIKSYQKNKQARELIEASLKQAKEYLSQQTEPDDRSSLAYAIYSLLQFGFQEHQIANLNERYIRNMSDSLLLRHFAGESNVQHDLDRETVDERDMNDREIEMYLK